MNPPTTQLSIWKRLLLIGSGLAVAVLLMLALLTFFPGLLQSADTPLERQESGETLHIEYHVSDGDLFSNMPGRIRPIPAEENVVLSAFDVTWDKDGFRLPARTADTYPIVALGDSFTEAVIVQQPWVDRVAAALDVPIYNYGYRAYGPLEEAQVAREFVTTQPRTWILYAFFAGNDLYDITRTYSAQERNAFGLLGDAIDKAADQAESEINPDEHYDFPLPVIIGDKYYDMAFLAEFLWVQRAPEEGFPASYNFRVLDNVLTEIKSNAGDASCLALIFIPTKEQLYYPYIYESERQWLRQIGQRQVLDGNEHLKLEPDPIAPEDEAAFIEATHQQRDAVAALAEKLGWRFIDLLPAFEEAVGKGELLYYPYDSHWNPDGHELAAQVIAEAMRDAEGCPLTPPLAPAP